MSYPEIQICIPLADWLKPVISEATLFTYWIISNAMLPSSREIQTIHYEGEAITDVDGIIPRIGASVTFYGSAIVRQFEMMHVFSANESQAIARSRDKLRSMQIMAREGIGMPITGFARSARDIDDLVRMVGGVPVVIKLLEGTQGVGVVLAETKKAAQSVLEAFLRS